ncbi:Phosphatidylinositolglycan class N-domain-containing protein [Roridomyces roridus]|uniref:GPI ethanolamine phosphate transferase 1 n=1 Tax=Roridomyces roridus TaxID=1738132 RepID=A0AAD7B0H3_9AGAR|nr:Phosphatidylinositolglycan class N-domain-containing protein [Roridomyces roridus]KAJ7640963.1 Phosphatidylinositolglycan class N-domain-containing protein [Roridomyces roridus]
MGSRYNVGALLFTGLLFHLVYIGSVFDCYFTSPVVHGMQSHGLDSAESTRLVLIVGDGLRADLLFQKNGFPAGIPNAPEVVAPYLRSIVETRGAFGVSHTRVPTESRPGHVAIIGGMYEDVSAVTKACLPTLMIDLQGWKTNPVDFDSVFNQSSHSFSFGSPDILPMFTRGAVPGKVMEWSYDEDEEDFTKDATALDVWVFDQLQALFQNATTNATLNDQLRAPGTVFFLHLLGLDTTGHSYRPHSEEYMNNIQVVDSIVRQTERLMEQFYQDKETSYIFTADHGMSVIGNHGDGHPDNTRTPLVAWGRGIRGPLPDSSPSSHDAYSEPWGFGHLLRRDVEQADLAPLMSTLVGIGWPVNSVGVLPDVDPTKPGYLLPREGDKALAQAAQVNAKMIVEQYRVKHELKKNRTVLYTPFATLEGSGTSNRFARLSSIEQAITSEEWTTARHLSAELIRDALEGLRYLQTYERMLIRGMAIAAYTGWAAYASLFIFRPLDRYNGRSNLGALITALSGFTFSSFCILFAVQGSPWTYYLYIAFPVYFWQQFLAQVLPVLRTSGLQLKRPFRVVLYGALVITALQSMVAAYVHRSIWSVGFLIIGVAWPVWSWTKESQSRMSLPWLWTASCLVTAIFPLLSVDKTESLPTILAGGASMILAGMLFAQRIPGTVPKTLFLGQGILIALSMLVTSSSVYHLQAKLGLPLLSQVSGWIVLITASLLPFVARVRHKTIASKLLMYFLAFGPCFVILSISVEGLFYVAYSITLAAWIDVERALRGDSLDRVKKSKSVLQYKLQPDDMRIALFFLFFVQVGFFGTGNVASISSFYLSPVYRLIPVFDPFSMAALLVFKIIAPYIILSVIFAALNDALHLPPFSLFLVALTLTDGMTLTFFFNVTDTGSWLEIGQTISFFCVTSLLLLWSAGICAGGEYLMADVICLNVKASE